MGTLKDMLSNALELGVFLHMGLIWGPWSGHSFTRDFRRKVRFCFIRGPCLLGNPIDM